MIDREVVVCECCGFDGIRKFESVWVGSHYAGELCVLHEERREIVDHGLSWCFTPAKPSGSLFAFDQLAPVGNS